VDFKVFSKAFYCPIQLSTFYFLLWKITETFLRIPFSVIGRCSQAASGMIFQNHRRLPVSTFSVKIDALGSLKRITGRIFKISK
jgi:hypothetical protein